MALNESAAGIRPTISCAAFGNNRVYTVGTQSWWLTLRVGNKRRTRNVVQTMWFKVLYGQVINHIAVSHPIKLAVGV